MKVKDVKEQIEEIQKDYDNMIKLQEYFLGHLSADDEEVKAVKTKLEEGADLNTSIRNLCSGVAISLSREVDRLNNLIDNAEVNGL